MRDLHRRGFLLGSAALGLAGCAGAPPEPSEARRATTLVDAFHGPSLGVGVFRAPIVGVERPFTARLDGVAHGDRFDVAEDFTFADGERQHLTWRFRRTGPATWEGRREDTVGVADVVESEGVVRLNYVADIRSGDSVTRLAFSDLIYRRADGVVINEGSVRRFGLPVGSVHFELRQGGASARR